MKRVTEKKMRKIQNIQMTKDKRITKKRMKNQRRKKKGKNEAKQEG